MGCGVAPHQLVSAIPVQETGNGVPFAQPRVVNLVRNNSREFADVDHVVDLAAVYDFSCIPRLATAFGIEDGLIQDHVFPLGDGNHGSVAFCEVAVI